MTLRSYLHALAEGDGAAACRQLTGDEARKALTYVVVQLPELGATSCTDALTKLSGSLGGNEIATLRDAKVDQVTVRSGSATAHVAGATRDARLTKTAGHWFISGGLFPSD